MKKLLILFLIGFISFSSHAQKKNKQTNDQIIKFKIDSTSVLTLDSTIKTLYAVISGEKEEQRHWEQFKFLFKPDAKLIASGTDQNGNYRVHYMTPQDYIKTSEKWLVENGFFEKEINRKVDTFGSITHVFSTYETFHSKSDTTAFMRGINSIQMFYDGKRWWVVNIYWAQETDQQAIPKSFLKN